jgi:hypothetical protein
MPLTSVGIIEIPGSAGLPFDHGAFDPKARRGSLRTRAATALK